MSTYCSRGEACPISGLFPQDENLPGLICLLFNEHPQCAWCAVLDIKNMNFLIYIFKYITKSTLSPLPVMPDSSDCSVVDPDTSRWPHKMGHPTEHHLEPGGSWQLALQERRAGARSAGDPRAQLSVLALQGLRRKQQIWTPKVSSVAHPHTRQMLWGFKESIFLAFWFSQWEAFVQHWTFETLSSY